MTKCNAEMETKSMQTMIFMTLLSFVAHTEASTKHIEVVRNFTDKWNEPRRCNGCVCRENSTYMIGRYKSRACFDSRDIRMEYGKNNLLFINKQPMIFLFTYDHSSMTWHDNRKQLYTLNNTKLSTKNCKSANFSKTEVFNFNQWQRWNIENHFQFLLGTDFTLFISFHGTNYSTFAGHLVRLKVQCNMIKKFDLLIKFEGTRKYTIDVPVASLLPIKKATIETIPPSLSKKEEKSLEKNFDLTTEDFVGIVVGASLGGVFLIIILMVVVFLVYNKRLKKQHLSAAEKENNGVNEDGERVIVNKDVLDLAQEILKERAEKLNNKPDVIPDVVPQQEKKPEKTFQGNFEQTVVVDPRISVIYEPIIDEHSGYTEPNPPENNDIHYQGIYLQPVDCIGCPVIYENRDKTLDKPPEEIIEKEEDETIYEEFVKS